MNLPAPTSEEIQQFQTLYREDFGVDLSREEALDRLIGLTYIAYVIYSKDEIFSLRPKVRRRQKATNPVNRKPDTGTMSTIS